MSDKIHNVFLMSRAKFSEITRQSVERALQTLEEPNEAMSKAVDVRSELDLRIGTDSIKNHIMNRNQTVSFI